MGLGFPPPLPPPPTHPRPLLPPPPPPCFPSPPPPPPPFPETCSGMPIFVSPTYKTASFHLRVTCFHI
eukprot:1707018-Rhodomonas_salina.1